MSMYGEELYGGGLYGGPGPGIGEGEGEDESWTVIGGAIVDTIAYGPAYFTDPDGLPIDSPGVYVAPFSLELVTLADMNTVLTELEDTFSRSFQDDANNTGSASLAITNSDTDFGDLALIPERLVNFKVYGNKALTMLIESMHKVAVAEGEEYDQITVCTGRGHLALWERWVLYPCRGPDSLPIEEDRVFNWTSPVYVDTGWKYATPISIQSSTTPAWTYSEGKAPLEFPDTGAYWIWAASGNSAWAQPGVCYFRKTFTVPAGITQIGIYYAIDNSGKIYIDGVPVAEQDGGHEWRTTKFITIDVTPGPHLIAIEAFNEPGPASQPNPPTPIAYTVVEGDTLWSIAERFYGSGTKWRTIYDRNQAQIQADAEAAGLWNPYDPGHWIFPGQVFNIPGILQPGPEYYNPGGVIVAIYEMDEEPTNLITHTNHTWKIVPYPASPPGMAPGHVIRLALQEASRRGNPLADEITLKFSDTVDSAGSAWPIVSDIASKVGTDYLTFLLELTTTYVDLWMAPGTLDLYAWNKGTRAALRDVTLHTPTDPDDPDTGNMYELSHTVLV